MIPDEFLKGMLPADDGAESRDPPFTSTQVFLFSPSHMLFKVWRGPSQAEMDQEFELERSKIPIVLPPSLKHLKVCI